MIHADDTVAQIVLDHSICAPIFQRLRIDFCCRGDVPLRQACAENGVDVTGLLRELCLAIADHDERTSFDPRLLDTRALVEHIVNAHHLYLRDILPFLVTLSKRVARVHGQNHPELFELCHAVEALRDDLIPHIDYEELVVFPALLARAPGDPIIQEALSTMHDEHPGVAMLLNTIRTLTRDYALPSDACTSYAALYRQLEDVEADTLRHVHLENNVLMPRFASLAQASGDQLR